MARIMSPALMSILSAGPLGCTPAISTPSCLTVEFPVNQMPIKSSGCPDCSELGGVEAAATEEVGAAVEFDSWRFVAAPGAVPVGVGSKTAAILMLPVELLRERTHGL